MPAVAVEPDPGAADPATVGAGEDVVVRGCWLRSLASACLSCVPFLPLLFTLQLSCLDGRPGGGLPFAAVYCQRFKSCWSNATRLKVALAHVFVAECWPTRWSGASGKLIIQNVIGESAIFHAGDMA